MSNQNWYVICPNEKCERRNGCKHAEPHIHEALCEFTDRGKCKPCKTYILKRKRKFEEGDVVRVIKCTTDPDLGEIPKRYMRRKGTVDTCHGAFWGEPPTYSVMFKGRQKPIVVYEDEVEKA